MNDQPLNTLSGLLHLTGAGPAETDALHQTITQCTLHSVAFHQLLRAAPTLPGEPWAEYWRARAKGTPHSRRAAALEHFTSHVRASHDHALHGGMLDAGQLRAVSGVLASPEWLRLEGRQLTIETPLLAGHALPGALIFTIEAAQQAVLYLPGRQPAFSAHASREVLEAQLLADTEAEGQISYQTVDSLTAGFDTLMDHLGRTPPDPARESLTVLAAPMPLAAPLDEPDPPSLHDFGNLTVDVPASIAARQVQRQLDLLQPFAEPPDALDVHRVAVHSARASAGQAIDRLLHDAAWRMLPSSTAPLAELASAQNDGLRAHARFQHMLGEISAQELGWIESLIAQGDTFPGPEALMIAAHPLLYRPSIEGQDTSADRQLIEEALVITHRAALDRSNTDHALLLYWPGEQGGLLRCADRGVLEQCLGADPQAGTAVGLSPVHGDVLKRILALHLERAREATAAAPADHDALAAHEDTLRHRLQVPQHAAREVALDTLRHEQDSASLAEVLPDWLARTPHATRLALREVLDRYATAMHQAQALLARDLPHRELFCWQRINRRLQQDFDGYDGAPVSLDLPRSTSRRRDPIAGSGAPGVPFREVLVPSAERELLSITDLLLTNIDEAMTDRLGFLTVHCPTADDSVRQALATGIDKDYLQALATELDLPQAYEDCILASYRGLDEALFAAQYRRECLVEPWRLMLELQGLLGLAQGTLDVAGQAILRIAVDADSHTRYRTEQHDIRLVGAMLATGGEDTAHQPSALAGVTFVNDQRSGITLLCLPEHPDQPLAQYASLEAARLALHDMTRGSDGRSYLASRALLGNPEAHASRMLQALEHGFDGIIALGSVWPGDVSLAYHLLDAQMGRVVVAHRATSRSNSDLRLEHYAYQSGMVFNYLKMALGFVPVVGTVIGVYDFFAASWSAAKALVEGQGTRALDELEQALLALIDAFMDLAPGVSVAVNAGSARRLARQRPVIQRSISAAPGRERLSRFAGYEHPEPPSLSGVQPGTQGRFKGVYQHGEGNFILVDDRLCQVQWDATAHTWRLAGTPQKGWKRAVALDEQGRWDTHFALFGTHLQGGGAGGGQVLGHLADQLDPYWPVAIRDRLPRFWVDRLYRHQHTLQSRALAEERQLQASLAQSNELFARFDLASDSNKLDLLAELERRCQADVDQGKQLYETWHAYQQVSTGRNRQVPLRQKARVATVVGDRLVHLMELKARRSRRRLADMGVIRGQITQIPEFAQQLPWWRQLRQRAIEHLDEREQIYTALDQLETWHTRAQSASTLSRVRDRYRQAFNPETREFFSTQHLMYAARRFEDSSASAAFFVHRLEEGLEATSRACNTLLDVQDVPVSAPQRRQIHEQLRQAYQSNKRLLQSTQASLPALFDAAYLEQLHKNLDALIARADRTIRRATTEARPPRGPSKPRLFETVEGQLYIGDYLPATASRPGLIVMHAENGTEIGRYVSAGERWQRQATRRPALPHEARDLRNTADRLLEDLDSYRARIEAYQRQGMLPADLEHMMVIKAEDLENCAHRLRELDGAAAEPAQLLTHARALRAQGTTLRVAQVKRGTQPSEGHLAYLVEQQQVELRRLQGRRQLKAGDYLEEYVILDSLDPQRTPLWYAHFHYRDPQAPFDQYTAAHLKLAADRLRGPETQQGQTGAAPVWRGAISRAAAGRYFAGL